MVAVCRGERSTRVLLNVMVAMLIAFPPSHVDLFGLVGTIAFAFCIPRQGEERFFQTSAGDFQA
jgi:hypothetical protein